MPETAKQTLWVTTIRPREVDGETSIPTAISYIDNTTINIGRAALAWSSDGDRVNVGFKIDLGDVNPGVVEGRAEFDTSVGKKTAYNLCNDFLTAFLSKYDGEFRYNGDQPGKVPAKVMVAEPLSFQVEGRSKNWLANYRSNLRRILSRYEEVDFLPEPFAVYQYYRYGLRVPRLTDRTKQIALIVDFGGGTFDACVIESTRDGDVSIRGKHSKPLAAKSIPCGGFHVNRRIALYLAKRDSVGAKRQLIDRYFRQYERVKRGELARDDLRQECQNFISNFEKLEQFVEQYKVDLSSSIMDWSLDGEAYENITVSCPKDPLRLDAWVNTEFAAHQFRNVFVQEVWKEKLKHVIRDVLKVATDGLAGRSITTTLISGGSSNIRWLEHLLEKDFAESLQEARPVPIGHSFQEVVANGLAIECARRFYSEDEDDDSEFVAVTYNPIKLYLGSDGEDTVRDCKFRSVNDRIDMAGTKPGDLIPSAQSLRHFFGQHLQWRVRLKSPPRRFLEYLFCRLEMAGSAELGDEVREDLFNVEENRLRTSKGKFDSNVIVDLQVRNDGTAMPKFIYQSENVRGGVSENAEVGRPFYIDMTTLSEKRRAKKGNYVGFDFGTSNCAICTLNESQIKLTQYREHSVAWASMSESLQALPYPVAIAVRRYLSLQSHAVTSARDAFEAGLAFMAYVSASEALHRDCIGKSLKAFQHRAMSPLWVLFENCQRALRGKGEFSQGLGRVLEDTSQVAMFREAMDAFTSNKHGKLADDERDWQMYVQLPLRTLGRGLEGFVFGRAMSSQPVPFSAGKHEGVFVIANDNQPFIRTIKYESDMSIDGSLALLVNQKTGGAISLSPFIFWYGRNGIGSQNCYFLDRLSSKGGGPTIKPCDRDGEEYAEDLSLELRRMIESIVDANGRGWTELSIRLVDED